LRIEIKGRLKSIILNSIQFTKEYLMSCVPQK
jgi:hypothetical protein